MIVPKTDSVPSRLSTISTSRAWDGQSMWAAVLSSQNPPAAAPGAVRRWGTTWLRWVCPFTHSTTLG